MPVSAKAVLERAQIVLQDAGAVRWPLTELVRWLNDGTKAIAFYKPSATATTTNLTLAAGTRQTIPAQYALMIRVVMNKTGASGAVGGKTVTPIVREILDAQKPDWHDPAVVTQKRLVRHVIADSTDPQVFYVYPGNDGNGIIEAVLSRIPAEIVPSVGADEDDISAYDQSIPELQSIYQQVLIDYILSMAFSKDMQFAGAADRAQAHMQRFESALGIRQQVESVANVNTTNSQPNS